MKVTRDQLRRIIKEELNRALFEIQFSAGDVESAGGGRSGGGPDPTKERCCGSWTNKTEEWRKAQEATKKAERDPESSRLDIEYLRDKEKELLDKIPKKFAPHGPSGDWRVDKCGNTRGEPVYKTVNGIKVFAYSCTHSLDGIEDLTARLTSMLSDSVIETFTPGTDLNRLTNLIDVTRISRWPSVSKAGEDLLDKKDAESSAIFVLSVLDAIPAGGLVLNMTKQGAAEALELINDEVLEDAGLNELQIKTAKKVLKDTITAVA